MVDSTVLLARNHGIGQAGQVVGARLMASVLGMFSLLASCSNAPKVEITKETASTSVSSTARTPDQPSAATAASIAEHRAAWERWRPPVYAFELTGYCMGCNPNRPIRIWVGDGQASARYIDDGSEVIMPGSLPTIDSLFDLLDRAKRDKWSVVAVAWNTQGWPDRIELDQSKDTADDEVSYVIADMRAASPGERPPSQSEKLAAARSRWQSLAWFDYQYDVERTCNECPKSWQQELTVTVRGGQVVDVRNRAGQPIDQTAGFTIDALFAAATVVYSFDDTTGAPSHLFVGSTLPELTELTLSGIKQLG